MNEIMHVKCLAQSLVGCKCPPKMGPKIIIIMVVDTLGHLPNDPFFFLSSPDVVQIAVGPGPVMGHV